jgi:neurexin
VQKKKKVEGNIFAVFNVGTHDFPLGEIGVKVNDNNYHVVRFTRNGGNATLQIDDYNVQSLQQPGKKMILYCVSQSHKVTHPNSHINSIIPLSLGHTSTVFNSMATIQVGGKVPKTGGRVRIERPFAGVIAGLSVNRVRVLDLASERDPQITIRGDVQLVTGVLDRNDLQSRMQQVRKFRTN